MDDQHTVDLMYFTIVSNGLSLFGCAFMIIVYFSLHYYVYSYRYKNTQTFPFKIVLYLNVADFILALGYIINY